MKIDCTSVSINLCILPDLGSIHIHFSHSSSKSMDDHVEISAGRLTFIALK